MGEVVRLSERRWTSVADKMPDFDIRMYRARNSEREVFAFFDILTMQFYTDERGCPTFHADEWRELTSGERERIGQ